MSKKYLDMDGLLYLWGKLKALTGGKAEADLSNVTPETLRTRVGEATAAAAGLMSASDWAKLAAFGPAEGYALRSDISAMYRYRGSRATRAELPAADNAVGDVWNVDDTGMNYAWTGENWDALGEVFAMESISNAEIDAATN